MVVTLHVHLLLNNNKCNLVLVVVGCGGRGWDLALGLALVLAFALASALALALAFAHVFALAFALAFALVFAVVTVAAFVAVDFVVVEPVAAVGVGCTVAAARNLSFGERTRGCDRRKRT